MASGVAADDMLADDVTERTDTNTDNLLDESVDPPGDAADSRGGPGAKSAGGGRGRQMERTEHICPHPLLFGANDRDRGLGYRFGETAKRRGKREAVEMARVRRVELQAQLVDVPDDWSAEMLQYWPAMQRARALSSL